MQDGARQGTNIQTCKHQTIAAALIFTALFLLVNGYRFGIGGGNVAFLPVLEALQGQGVDLPSDFNLLAYKYYHFNFDLLCLAFSTIMPLTTLFLAGYLLCGALFYLSITRLARVVSLDEPARMLALSFLLLWGSNGLEANTFWYSAQFAPYLLSWPLAIYGLAYFLEERALAACLALALCCFVHIQTGLDVSLAVFLSLIVNLRNFQMRFAIRALLLALLLIAPLLIENLLLVPHSLLPSGELFLVQASFRSPHHFEIQPRQFLGISLCLALAAAGMCYVRSRAVFSMERLSRLEKICSLCFVIYLLGLLHYLDFYVLRTGLIARLQFTRISPLIQLFAIFAISKGVLALLARTGRSAVTLAVLLGFYIGPLCLATGYFARWSLLFCVSAVIFIYFDYSRKALKPLTQALPLSMLGLLICKILMVAASTQHFFVFNPLALKGSAWIEACLWIEQHTESTARFITPPHQEAFMLYAKRAMVADYFTNPHLSLDIIEWRTRISDLSGGKELQCRGWECLLDLRSRYALLSEEGLVRLAAKFSARYFLTDSRSNYSFDLIYANADFKLYRLGS